MKILNNPYTTKEFIIAAISLEENESMLMDGKQHAVKITSGLSDEVKQKILTTDFTYDIVRCSNFESNHSKRIGLFSGYKYSLAASGFQTSYVISFNDKTQTSLSISCSTNLNKFTELSNTSTLAAEERREWLRENADSYEDFRCSIS